MTRIMPFGDSNTYGMYENLSSPGGYRGPLQDMLRGGKLGFDLVGLDRDGRIGDADHNGYPGKMIDWFTRPVNEAIRDRDGSYSHTIDSGSGTAVRFLIEQAGMTPDDVVLIHLGTNDVRLGDSAGTMLAEMRVLLDQIVGSGASPMVQLMTLAPVRGDIWAADGDPGRTNNDTIRAFNEGLERMVAEGYGALGVTLVDSGVTTAGLSPDGVHMNAAGYASMARAWFESLVATGQVEALPEPPLPPPPASGNLLVNGSFETAGVGSDQHGAFQSLQGWTALTGGRIEVWNNHKGVRATEGVNFLELDFAGGRDGFFQDIEATAGRSYSLGFDLRARPDRAVWTQDVEVVWNDRVVAVAKPGKDWGSFTATVTGQSGTDRLTIREVASQAGDGHGALLDNFRLVANGAAAAPPEGPRGEDTLVVKVSGDSFKGDPAFALSVNGRVVSASTTVTADRAAGEWDSFVFRGDFGLDGSDRVAITFLNDRYEGSADRDRNLYVDEVVLNGEVNGRDESFHQTRTDYWDF
ncbi:carbohydrate-binding domain-containing protein [Paracoccus sp. MC1862]|uniref:carbohydrate-binding domain-containing protein n=1 Tax=Paracoccus sp. MC1862 TaxID=2760307 RepID=UPI0016044886|nr:carbohydrate-binding domain-containing protein [Paracoccus sp. MC1862]MBB1498443.1 hypothetical protein [Paracoccus sp. MC1862]QQO46694.1 hypothetical protein JGR78_17025 [Paracoccus sp. MC1862]